MGFHLPLYFILLLLFLLCPILQAAESQEPACGKEACGNITIPSPFGMHSSCYTKPWFRVTCNPTLNGVKPFINVNGIDLEVLGKALYSNAILINNPVTYINCDRINEVSGRVNLLGTPFFFSSKRNYFGSVGSGNLATILSKEAVSLGGCSQPRCDDGASESGCCTQITANLTSYTVNMRAMYPIAEDAHLLSSLESTLSVVLTHYPLASIMELRMFPPCSTGIPPIVVTEVSHALSLQ